MLRILVLTLSHLTMFACGVGITALAAHSRRQSMRARSRALELREIFLDDILAGRTAARALPTVLPHSGGRHRAADRDAVVSPHVRAPRISLLPNATLDEAVAFLATQRARRVQDARAAASLLAGSQWAWSAYIARTPRAPRLLWTGR